MPTPRAGESQEDFVNRCIPIVIEDGTAEDNDQAVAICRSLWEDSMSKTIDRAQEHKTLPLIVTKIDGDQGIVEHTVAVMGNVDLGKDRIHPGAFTKTIMERMGKIRVLDTHNSTSVLNVIGKPLSLWEVSKEQLPGEVREQFPQATGALMARTQFLLDTPEGMGVFARIKAGAVNEYSIGYDVLDSDYTDEELDGKKETVRNLRTIRLWEYSPVTFAMNPATSTVSAKQDRFGEEQGDMEADRYEPTEEEDKGATGSTALPIAGRDRAWDATAAQRRVRSWANAEDAPNARYRRAFFWYDASAADQFGSYKLQFADVIDGTLTAIPRGVFAVAAVLQGSRGGVDIPEGDRAGVRSRVSRYYGRMRSQFDDEGIVPPWEKETEPELEEKIGRVLSAANIGRIQSAIDTVQAALSDLEEMLSGAMPTVEEEEEQSKEAPPQEEAALDQQELAGPDTEPPTKKALLEEIERALEDSRVKRNSLEVST